MLWVVFVGVGGQVREVGRGRGTVGGGVDGNVDPPLLLWGWLREVGGQVPEVRGG